MIKAYLRKSFWLLIAVGFVYMPAETWAQKISDIQLDASSNWQPKKRPLYNPRKIAVLGQYLVIIDEAGDNQILILNNKNKKIVKKMGRSGRGPMEFMSPWNLFISHTEKKSFCIYDLRLRKITCFRLRDVLTKKNFQPLLSFTLKGKSGIPLRIGTLPEANKFIVTSIFGTNPYRFLIMDKNNEILVKSATINHPRKRKSPLNVYQHAYTVLPISNFKGNKIALAYFYTNIIEIYSKDGALLHTIKPRSDFFHPLFTVRQTSQGPTMAQGGDTRLAFVDINSSRKHIFALYSGRKRSDVRTGQSNILNVYTWKGKLNAVFHLDRDVVDCAIKPAGRKMYCIENSGRQASVVEYNLPDIAIP